MRTLFTLKARNFTTKWGLSGDISQEDLTKWGSLRSLVGLRDISDQVWARQELRVAALDAPRC